MPADQPPDPRDTNVPPDPPRGSAGRIPAADDVGVGRDGVAAELTFPDLPRMELDQLLGQLVQRAQEVMATQGRLRGLLRANQLITADLTLSAVLRRIAEAARELVGARYAALGVIAPTGGLAEFVHSGMPEDAVERIGHLPHGKGLLGALIEDPQPIRLRRISDDGRSSGFPPGHPPMSSFLGVPVRVRDEIFGNLYLAESTKGEFSAEDEELTKALAATAGVAVENSRLYDAARSRGEWLQATAAITRRLLSAEPDHPLQLIADRCAEIAAADLVTVALPDGEDFLQIEVAVGIGAEEVAGLRLPLEGSLSGRVLGSGIPLRGSRADHEMSSPASRVTSPVDGGPLLILPLRGSQRVYGVLSMVRRRDRAPFTAEDLDMASGFANQAAVAIELSEARAEQQRVAMLDERDRIAADLHDHVIQRLFAAGLRLQSVAGGLPPGRAAERVLATVDDLDDTISQIRTTIFHLQQVEQRQGTGPSLRIRLLDVIAEAVPGLGVHPSVRFTGLLEDVMSADLADDLLAVVREALSNIARHAGARSVELDLTSEPGRLTLDVRDDGRGIGESVRRSGLTTMRSRAERHGGTFSVTPRQPSGTCLFWSVPVV